MKGGAPLDEKVLSKDFLLLCLTNFLFWGTYYFLVVTLPTYIVSLGGLEGQAGFFTAGTSFASVLLLPYIGRQVDIRGRSKFMHLGIAIMLVAALAFPWIRHLALLVLLAGLCGAAVACFQPASVALTADSAPISRRGEALGIFGTFTTMAVATSPVAATFIMLSQGFTTLFAATAALAAVALALSWKIRGPAPPMRGDEKRSHLINRGALVPAWAIFCMTISHAALLSFLPRYAPKIGMDNPGIFFTTFALSMLTVRALAGSLSDKLGRMTVIVPALLVMALALFGLANSTTQTHILLAAFFYGLGYGSAHPSILALVVDRAGTGGRGSAVSTFSAAYSLGLGVGALGLGAVLEMGSFQTMMTVAGIAPLMGLSVLLAGVRGSSKDV